MNQRLVPIVLAALLVLAVALCLPERAWSAEAPAPHAQFAQALNQDRSDGQTCCAMCSASAVPQTR
jgi:hypothetical protein